MIIKFWIFWVILGLSITLAFITVSKEGTRSAKVISILIPTITAAIALLSYINGKAINAISVLMFVAYYNMIKETFKTVSASNNDTSMSAKMSADENEIKHFGGTFYKILLTIVIVPFILDYLLNILISGSETNDGWLGFFGGYLGAIITILGVYWQVSKQSKDGKEQLNEQFKVSRNQLNEQIAAEKEARFREARPLFILSFREMQPKKLIELPIYSSGQNQDNLNTGDELQFINIKNVSNNTMAGVKILLYKKGNQIDSEIMISSIREHNECLVINDSSLSKARLASYKNFGENQPDPTKMQIHEMKKLERIDIYFTTPLREKIKLSFHVVNGNPKYYKSDTMIENKGCNLDCYTLDSFQESRKD